MSSFKNFHRIYLFSMKNGKKKLAYGENPGDALEVLSYRLNDEEMSQIEHDNYEIIKQRDLLKYTDLLG